MNGYLVRCRWNCIEEEKLEEIPKDFQFSIHIGVESTDDVIREKIIHKGLPNLKLLDKKIRLLDKYGIDYGFFVLQKPPFLTEKEGIEDNVKTKELVERYPKGYIIYPLFRRIYLGTVDYILLKHNLWSIPWLWSVVEVLSRLSKSELKKVYLSVINQPVETKLTHNRIKGKICKCNERIIELMWGFSFTLDKEYVKMAKEIECECKEEWYKELEKDAKPLEERIPKYWEIIYEEVKNYR